MGPKSSPNCAPVDEAPLKRAPSGFGARGGPGRGSSCCDLVASVGVAQLICDPSSSSSQSSQADSSHPKPQLH